MTPVANMASSARPISGSGTAGSLKSTPAKPLTWRSTKPGARSVATGDSAGRTDWIVSAKSTATVLPVAMSMPRHVVLEQIVLEQIVLEQIVLEQIVLEQIVLEQIIAAPVYAQSSHTGAGANSSFETRRKLLKYALRRAISLEIANSLTIQQWNGLAGA